MNVVRQANPNARAPFDGLYLQASLVAQCFGLENDFINEAKVNTIVGKVELRKQYISGIGA